MRLKLQNISIIKKADIQLDGLTVIAGENDTGKSTVGKVLYMMIKSILWGIENDRHHKGTIDRYIKKIFDKQISEDGQIELTWQNNIYTASIKRNHCNNFISTNQNSLDLPKTNTPLFIESPLVWNFFDMFKDLANIQSQTSTLSDVVSGSEISFPTLMHELYFTLAISRKTDTKNEVDDINQIIGGSFKEESGKFYFYKNNKKIALVNTATGVKYFGLLQVLMNNNHLYHGQILILDEPEVHLHPKWQLELAKIIVSLVKSGVKILVNSHSPYMIEALERYAKKESIKRNFYLAEDGVIEDNDSLSKIFAKLSEPFDEFDKMDSEVLHG